jgi:hypothetical protein
MKMSMIAALLVVVPAVAFAQMLPSDLQSIDRAEEYDVNTASGVSTDHAPPHMIGDIKARSVRVGGHTVMLVEGAPAAPAVGEPVGNGS